MEIKNIYCAAYILLEVIHRCKNRYVSWLRFSGLDQTLITVCIQPELLSLGEAACDQFSPVLFACEIQFSIATFEVN